MIGGAMPSRLTRCKSYNTAQSIATNFAACKSNVFKEDMVFETTGHWKAPSYCISIPSRLFQANLSVNAIGIKRSIFIAFFIVASQLKITIGMVKIYKALKNTFIISNEERSNSWNFSVLR